MFIATLSIFICGLIAGSIYAHLFLAARKALMQTDAHTIRKKSILTSVFRFIFIGGVFWYLLRLPASDRILFLGAFICGFWFFIIVTQRRLYERN
jgi:drug/metabolite transporter (DMT)-like permease